jgi:hypothetical protein
MSLPRHPYVVLRPERTRAARLFCRAPLDTPRRLPGDHILERAGSACLEVLKAPSDPFGCLGAILRFPFERLGEKRRHDGLRVLALTRCLVAQTCFRFRGEFDRERHPVLSPDAQYTHEEVGGQEPA